MRTKKAVKVAMVAILLGIVAGCAKPPDSEESQARQAMTAAREAKAEKYAPELWRMAQDTLQAAATEKQLQDDKFVFFRKYDNAKTLFIQTTNLANRARTKAEPALQQARTEAKTLLQQARTSLEKRAAELSNVHGGKDYRADVELLNQDVAALRQLLKQAETDFQRADFDQVKAKAQDVLEKVAAM